MPTHIISKFGEGKVKTSRVDKAYFADSGKFLSNNFRAPGWIPLIFQLDNDIIPTKIIRKIDEYHYKSST